MCLHRHSGLTTTSLLERKMIDVQAMFPVMVVQDLEVLKQFYEKNFGFSTAFYEAGF